MRALTFATLVAAAVFSGTAFAAPPSAADDRLIFSASGSTLTDTNGGGGASITWLHTFNAGAVLGLGGEYQGLADATWKFGSLNFSYGLGPADRRSTFYVEGHEGSGVDSLHSWTYSLWAVGLIQSVTHQAAIQLEDRQIDINTTHGNLPKVGLQYLWTPKLLTTVAYQHSVGGDLGTRIGSLRIDHYGQSFNLILGGAGGQATPVVFNLLTHELLVPALHLREGFIGIGKSFARSEVTLLGDYTKLADTERVTVTLNYAVHLRGRGSSK